MRIPSLILYKEIVYSMKTGLLDQKKCIFIKCPVGWVFESQPRYTEVVKTGCDSSNIKRVKAFIGNCDVSISIKFLEWDIKPQTNKHTNRHIDRNKVELNES